MNSFGRLRGSGLWRIISPFKHLVRNVLEYGRLKKIYGKSIARTNTFAFKRCAKKYLIGEIEHQTDDVFPDQSIKFSVLVPLYNTPERYLREMIESVLAQTYKNFELVLSDAGDSEHEYVREICEAYANADPRVIYIKHEKELGISENTNEALRAATGDYAAFLDHDDKLMLSALSEMARTISKTRADVCYSDEFSFEKDDPLNVGSFFFKGDFSIYDLRGLNYICHFVAVKRRLLLDVGGLRAGFDGAQDHDLMLRLSHRTRNIVHVPKLLYKWRVHTGSTASGAGEKDYASRAGLSAVREELSSFNIGAGVEVSSSFPTVYRISYIDADDVNVVTLVLLEGGKLPDLRKQGITSDNMMILVADQGVSVDDEAINELKSIAHRMDVGAAGGMLVDGKGNIVSNGVEYRDQSNPFVITNDAGRIATQTAYNRRLHYARSVDEIKGAVLMRTGLFLECARELGEGDSIEGLCHILKKRGYHLIIDPYARITIS